MLTTPKHFLGDFGMIFGKLHMFAKFGYFLCQFLGETCKTKHLQILKRAKKNEKNGIFTTNQAASRGVPLSVIVDFKRFLVVFGKILFASDYTYNWHENQFHFIKCIVEFFSNFQKNCKSFHKRCQSPQKSS